MSVTQSLTSVFQSLTFITLYVQQHHFMVLV